MTAICTPSPFAVDGLLYIASGSGGGGVRPMFAIRPGATGDISLKDDATTNEFIKWSLTKVGPYTRSPIVYRGLLYAARGHTISCFDALTGERHFRKRFPTGISFVASPWGKDFVTYRLLQIKVKNRSSASCAFHRTFQRPIFCFNLQ